MKHALISFLALSTVLLSGCASTEKVDPSTPEGAFKIAEQYEKDDRYEEAIQKFQDVKNKHPYSRFAVLSELRIADINFKRESYVEAQGAYQLFKEFHPKHPQSDYVTYRLALSYFNQLPSSIDRDLSVADKSILYFDETINSYPNSEYVADARSKKDEALHMLAEKEMYVARFYVRKKSCDSAIKRFEAVIKNYANVGFDAEALYGAAKCSFELGNKDKAQVHLGSLYSRFPSSDQAKKARNEFARYGEN